jgi:hypothetical protein
VRALNGTEKSGNAASLAAADGDYYVLSTLNSGAQWAASIFGMPSTLSSLTVTYRGHVTTPCTQNVYLWNWYYSAWVSISNSTATTSDSTLVIPAPGLVNDYIFLGELRASVQCFRTDGAGYDLAGDQFKINYG